MGTLGNLAFGVVGMLMIATYGALLYMGALPESALAIGLGGGLALGVLVKIAFTVATPSETEEQRPSLDAAMPVLSHPASAPRAAASGPLGPAGVGASARLARNAE